MTWKPEIVLERFCLNAKISVMMTNHQNLSNAQRDFKDNNLQTLKEKVEIGPTLKMRLHLNAPPPAPSAILFQTLKRHFLKFKTWIHVGMRLIVKTTKQQIGPQPSNKLAKASRYSAGSELQQFPKSAKSLTVQSACFPPSRSKQISANFFHHLLGNMSTESERLRCRNLKILQYNVHKSKDIVKALLVRDPHIKSYDILAIQEPWRNNFTPTTHHPLKDIFRLYYPGLDNLEEKARVCFFVNKRFKPEDVEVLFHSGDFMILTTNLSLPESAYNQHNIHIHKFYNEPDDSNGPVLDDFTSILSQTAIAANNLPYKMTTDHVIVRDFNIHHPSWGCKTTQADNWVLKLLEIIDEFDLTQHLSPRTTKYISPLGSESTINLEFTSARLTEKIQIFDVVEALDHDSDHLSIGTILDLSLQNTEPDTRYSYNQTNTKVFNGTLLALLPFTPTNSSTPEVLDKYVIQLINAISHTVYISILQTLPNVWVTLGFDRFCKAAFLKANKTKRHLKEETRQDPKSRETKQAYLIYWKSRKCKKRLVESKYARNGWSNWRYGNITECKLKKQQKTQVRYGS